jgi:hypothetical protein
VPRQTSPELPHQISPFGGSPPRTGPARNEVPITDASGRSLRADRAAGGAGRSGRTSGGGARSDRAATRTGTVTPRPADPRVDGGPALARSRAARLAGAVPERLLHTVPHHRRWLVTIAAISVVVAVAMCGFGFYNVVWDEQQGAVVTGPAPSPTPPKRDITNRKVDPKRMTAKDVFPATNIAVAPGVPAYKMVGNVQSVKDCRVGATADLGKLLRSLGCNQLVRATLTTTDKNYFVTAGIFNLTDDVAARQAHEEIKALVDKEKGRFTGFISTKSTQILGRAPTQLAWDFDGHFLAYCVIARKDGKSFKSTDPNPRIIVYDIVETYLIDRVIAEWSIDRDALNGSASPGAPPSAGPPSPRASSAESGSSG